MGMRMNMYTYIYVCLKLESLKSLRLKASPRFNICTLPMPTMNGEGLYVFTFIHD